MKIQTLKKFINEVRADFREYINANNIQPLTLEYFTNSPPGYISKAAKDDWSLVLAKFIEKKVAHKESFTATADQIHEQIRDRLNEDESQGDSRKKVNRWLINFISHILQKDLSGDLIEDELVENIHAFLSALQSGAIEQKLLFFLKGIYLKVDVIEFEKNISLRSPTERDLEWELHSFIPYMPIDIMDVPGSILEYRSPSTVINDPKDYIEPYVTALRLFKVGSVYSQRLKNTKMQSFGPQVNSWMSIHPHCSEKYKYTVLPQTKRGFVKFIKEMTKLSDRVLRDGSLSKINISLDRYSHALLEPLDRQRCLMTAVMGLEAMLSRNKDRGENAYKLSMRTARLMGAIGFNAVEVFDEVAQSYDFRNKVVHGLQIKENKDSQIRALLPKIINYLRLVLIFFIGAGDKDAEKYINLIEASLLDSTREKELKLKLNGINNKLGNTLRVS